MDFKSGSSVKLAMTQKKALPGIVCAPQHKYLLYFKTLIKIANKCFETD